MEDAQSVLPGGTCHEEWLFRLSVHITRLLSESLPQLTVPLMLVDLRQCTS